MRSLYDSHPKAALLKKMLNRLDRMLRSGELQTLSPHRRRSFARRLRRLNRQLKPNFARLGLRPAMIAALAAIGIGTMPQQAQAQSFDSTQVNPFMLTNISASEPKPDLADIDGDGDLDLFVGTDDGDILFAENIGSATSPMFDSLQTNPFGISQVNDYAVPELVDIDADGDYDLFIGQGYPISIRYSENIGTNMAPQFDSLQTNPFGINLGTMSDYEAKPATADLDGDGDFDMMVGTAYGAILYLENVGTASSPMFGTVVSSPFGISITGTYLETSFTDLDNDADMDFAVQDPSGNLTYFENTGTPMAPAFGMGQVNPFNIQQAYGYSGVVFADLDGDTDFDLLKGVDSGDIWYQENLDSSLVVVNQPPVIALSTVSDSVCSNDTLGPIAFTVMDPDSPTLTVTLASSNQSVIQDQNINLSGTAPNFSLTAIPTTFGNTDIIVTASDSSLTVMDTISVQVDDCSIAIDEGFFAKRFVVHPNPADHQLGYRLDLHVPVTQLKLEMVNLQGQVVQTEGLEATGTEFSGVLDISDLSAGIYFLRVQTDVYRLNRKVVVE